MLLNEWSKLKIFTIGEITGRYLFDKLKLDSVGQHTGSAVSLAEFILESMAGTDKNKPLVYPCSNIRTDFITNHLQDKIHLQEIVCYETRADEQINRHIELFKDYLYNSTLNIDRNIKIKLIILFFSPSGVEHLLPHLQNNILTDRNLNDHLVVKFGAIGKTTAAKMTDCGLNVWFVASSPKARSLVSDLNSKMKELN